MYERELLERNMHPINRGVLKDANIKKVLTNTSCGDELTIFLSVKNGMVVDGAWEGRACAIAQVSADLFIDAVRGRKIDELAQMSWLNMPELESVKRMPARVKCAELAWKMIEIVVK